MRFGEIKIGGKFGGFNLLNKPTSEIPPQVSTAIKTICNVNGWVYTPIWYFGDQVVNGVNHLVVCKREKDNVKQLVVLIINIPTNSNGKNATVISCTERADLYGKLEELFETALKDITGVKYTPLAFMGDKVVKGKNYYILSQARISDSEPYAVIIEINEFMDKITLIGIERLGGLGYAFTW